jgi:hypothetical protein
MVPHEPETQPMPDTVQFTVVFELPVTVALNCCWPFTGSVAPVGAIATETVAADPIVTVALPVCVASKIETAVTMTVAGLGAVAGAV